MAEKTVREQLAEALETLLNEADVPEAHADCLSTESGPCNCVFARGREALDRHRAEPEESVCTDACDQPSEAHTTSDCPCWQAGYDEARDAR